MKYKIIYNYWILLQALGLIDSCAYTVFITLYLYHYTLNSCGVSRLVYSTATALNKTSSISNSLSDQVAIDLLYLIVTKPMAFPNI